MCESLRGKIAMKAFQSHLPKPEMFCCENELKIHPEITTIFRRKAKERIESLVNVSA